MIASSKDNKGFHVCSGSRNLAIGNEVHSVPVESREEAAGGQHEGALG